MQVLFTVLLEFTILLPFYIWLGHKEREANACCVPGSCC